MVESLFDPTGAPPAGVFVHVNRTAPPTVWVSNTARTGWVKLPLPVAGDMSVLEGTVAPSGTPPAGVSVFINITTGQAYIPNAGRTAWAVLAGGGGSGGLTDGTADPTGVPPAGQSGYINRTLATIWVPNLARDAWTRARAAMGALVAARSGGLSTETAGASTIAWANLTGRPFNITSIRTQVGTASVGSPIVIEVRKNGAGSAFFTDSVPAGVKVKTTTALALQVAADEYIEAWTTGVGSTTPGSNLSIIASGYLA